jgi:hypothetical protein
MRMHGLAMAGIVVLLGGCLSGFDAASQPTQPVAKQATSPGANDAPAVPIEYDPEWHALSVERLPNNPVIRPEMLPGDDGANIDGPSLIRVPDWVKNPQGKYYFYFAHHLGHYIRLAYADRVEGPWKVYTPGTLNLRGTVCDSIANPAWKKRRHIASPDVHVDEKTHEIRMYFHCPAYHAGPQKDFASYKQVTFVATSKDGIHFEVVPEPLGKSLGHPFFRVFWWGGAYYALSIPGTLYRSPDGIHGWVEGPTLFTKEMRHSAVLLHKNTLLVFYSVIGDNPESILVSSIPLVPDWMKWKATAGRVVLKPEREWEGASLPAEPSKRGPALAPARQLRDPAIFVDDGRTFLLYSVAGEHGIAIAEVHWH